MTPPIGVRTSRRGPGRGAAVSALCLLLLAGSGVAAQSSPPGEAYDDPGAEALHRAAQRNWADIDESVIRYTARVQQRIAAMIRAPLKDRVVYRNESAVRVFWDRDHDTFVQVLGARSQYPGSEYAGIEDVLDDLTIEQAFDPGSDRLVFFGSSDDDPGDVDRDEDFWIAHPLAPGADSLYRFERGDSLTLSFPDGRQLRTVELRVIPRRIDVHLLTGALWIEPESGALVRAIYRLSDQFDAMRDVPELQEGEARGEFRYVPGIFKPWTFDLKIVAVDYSLWDFRVWLPRSMRFEGQVAAGILKFPIEFDLAYRVENVVLEEDLGTPTYEAAVLEERHFESRAEAMAFLAELMSREEGYDVRPLAEVEDGGGRAASGRFLVPRDPNRIRNSDQLPPPIWEDAPGFASDADIESMFGSLADLPLPPVVGIPWSANWGFQRPDLVRYNRVEGPALGGRAEARIGSFLGPLDLRATGFLGLADLEPKLRLDVTRSSLRRSWEFGAFHEVRPMQPAGRHLGIGNSLNALLFGRDDGEYYRSTGFDVRLSRPEAERQAWALRGWLERQDPLPVETSFALVHAFDGDWRFRPNLQADPVEEAGASLTLTPFWGGDPLLPQFGMELEAAGGAYRIGSGDVDLPAEGEWARARAILRAAIPLAGARWRVGLEAGGGHSWGDPPAQRAFLLGGPLNLRGYDTSVLSGPTFGRARMEVARRWAATSVSFFGDAGWAGIDDAFDRDDILYSAGVGTSILDGLIRLDLSRGLAGPSELRRTRLDLYLDAIL